MLKRNDMGKKSILKQETIQQIFVVLNIFIKR